MYELGQVGALASPASTPRQGESPDEPRDSSAREQQLTLTLPGLARWLVWGAVGVGGACVLAKVAEALLHPEDVVPNPSCPLTDYSFGGISEDEYFGSSTEYEIGARRMIESCRCILGSLGKITYVALQHPELDFHQAYGVDENYMGSKVDRLVKDRREYSRPLYAARMEPKKILADDTYLDPQGRIDSARASVYSIRSAAPKLVARARKLRSGLCGCDLPPEAYYLAFSCYKLLEELGEAMMDGVEDFPERVTNPFCTAGMISAVSTVEAAAEKFFAAHLAARGH